MESFVGYQKRILYSTKKSNSDKCSHKLSKTQKTRIRLTQNVAYGTLLPIT